MNDQMAVLKADIERDEAEIARLYEKLAAYSVPPQDPEQTIVVAYYLHNLYTAFEHICELVADAFENRIGDRSQWHALLLRRMTQDISDIRPRLFSEGSYDCLDELRRFRRVFRSAYKVSLDPRRLELVLEKAAELKPLYEIDLGRFRQFLDTL